VEKEQNYFKSASKFIPMFKNFSTNSASFELICIIRWMCICEYMETHNIERAFIHDTDVLIFDNMTKLNETYFKNYDFMLCSSATKNLAGCLSIWDLSKLKEFIDFIFEFYESQFDKLETWWKTYSQGGGICDMTLLYYFANKEINFVGLRLPGYPSFGNDLTQVFENEFTCDLIISASGNHLYPEEYEMNTNLKIKNIKFIDETPHCFNKRLGKYIRFGLLHFQGGNKKFMKEYFYDNHSMCQLNKPY
tara:strand:- start:342 stop:1088 length:747 start_codon:yes stop_codon:yes gene_type:complete